MANLIITIISIALVAVAALMGAYYGGAAFLEGQAKARANALVNKASQIGGAWVAFSASQGGSRTITPWSTLVPAYLQEVPINDFEPAGATISGWDIIPYGSGDDQSYVWGGNDFSTNNHDTLIAQINSQAVCLRIRKMSAGEAATLSDHGAGDPVGNGGGGIVAANGKFDCLFYDVDDTYFFIYRAF